jgi:hypothetical protein
MLGRNRVHTHTATIGIRSLPPAQSMIRHLWAKYMAGYSTGNEKRGHRTSKSVDGAVNITHLNSISEVANTAIYVRYMLALTSFNWCSRCELAALGLEGRSVPRCRAPLRGESVHRALATFHGSGSEIGFASCYSAI